MKKLPSLYKNNNISPKDNNKKQSIIKEEVIDNNKVLDSIFNGLGHAYNIRVELKVNNNLLDTYLVSRTKNNILTLDGKTINLKDIDYIKIKED